MQLMSTRARRPVGSLLAMALVAVLATGCGGDDEDTTTAAGTTTGTAAAATSTGVAPERTEEAKKAAEADAEKAGGRVDPPTGKKIGFMYLSKSTEASVRQYEDLKTAADLFGFEIVTCDPNFDPAKTAQCATSLVAAKPDLIISAASPTSALGGGLKAAHDQGIPWIMTGAVQTPSEYYTAQYVPDERELSKTLNDWVFQQLQEKNGNVEGTLVAFQAPTVGAGVIDRDKQRAEDLKAHPGLKQKTHDIDLADAVQDTIKTTKQFVQNTPDVVALWNTCDFCTPPMGQALDQLGKNGDDRPVTVGIYTTKQSREQIKAGKVSGAVENNFGAQSMVAIDQAVQHWARDTPFAKDASVFSEGYGIKILEPWIVTKDNVGDTATVRNQGEDYETYFKTKWAAEFGVGS